MVDTGYHVIGETTCFQLIEQYARENPDGDKEFLLRLNDFEEMQFTGLKDKNGKDIYEGDLCNRENWTGNPYYVRYSKDGWFWCGSKETDEQFFTNRDCLYDSDRLRNGIESCEIIGNIFENPELLKNNN